MQQDTTIQNIEAWLRICNKPCFQILRDNGTSGGTCVQDNIEGCISEFRKYYVLLMDGIYTIKVRPNAKSSYTEEYPFVKGNPNLGNFSMQNAAIGGMAPHYPYYHQHAVGQVDTSKLDAKIEKLQEKLDDKKEEIQRLQRQILEMELKEKYQSNGIESLLTTPEGIGAISQVIQSFRQPMRAAVVGTMEGESEQTTQHRPSAAAQLKMQRIITACSFIEQNMEIDMAEVLEKLAELSENDPNKLTMALKFL